MSKSISASEPSAKRPKQDTLHWLESRGFTLQAAKEAIGAVERTWERFQTGAGTVLLAVPAVDVLAAYALLPSAVRVPLRAETSPPFELRSSRQQWIFAEYEADSLWRPLDCTGKPVADRDPDYESSGDLCETFLGAILTVSLALLERGVVAPELRIEAVEVAKGYSGECRVLPIHSMRVAVGDEDCEQQMRRMLLTLLSSLPTWVKEDPICVSFVEALSAKKSRRDPGFVNSVLKCISDARDELSNAFAEAPAFSPAGASAVRPPTVMVVSKKRFVAAESEDEGVGLAPQHQQRRRHRIEEAASHEEDPDGVSRELEIERVRGSTVPVPPPLVAPGVTPVKQKGPRPSPIRLAAVTPLAHAFDGSVSHLFWSDEGSRPAPDDDAIIADARVVTVHDAASPAVSMSGSGVWSSEARIRQLERSNQELRDQLCHLRGAVMGYLTATTGDEEDEALVNLENIVRDTTAAEEMQLL